jgi:replicative DNA helicase
LTNELRVPPHNLEAEAVVLAAMMLDAQDCVRIASFVKSDWFYHLQNQSLYELLRGLHDNGTILEPIAVAEYAERIGKLEAIGGGARLVEILEFQSATPLYYAQLMERAWLKRQLIDLGRSLIEQGYEPEDEPHATLSAAAEQIIELQAGKTCAEVRLSDSLTETLQNIDERTEKPVGIPTGFNQLDEKLGGLRPGQLIILAARPAVGKSALALGVGRNVAASNGAVLFVSLEMSHMEQTERLLSSEASVDSRRLLLGNLNQDDSRSVLDAANAMKPLPLFFLDQAFDSDSIFGACKAVHIKHNLSLIICDYLQLCEVNGIPENQRERAVAKLSRGFKRLAQQLQIPVIALSQLNREVEKRKEGRPILSDLRESGAIEQDANVVLFLHRPDLKDPEDQPGVAELIVAKNRGGSTGVIVMGFRKEFTRFEDQPIHNAGSEWDNSFS